MSDKGYLATTWNTLVPDAMEHQGRDETFSASFFCKKRFFTTFVY